MLKLHYIDFKDYPILAQQHEKLYFERFIFLQLIFF